MSLKLRLFSLLGAVLLPGSLLAQADIIYHNGDVVTLEADGVVEAIAIKGDAILAVGNNTDILSLQGTESAVIDLQGRALLPGFWEAHSHVLWEKYKQDVSLADAQQAALSFGLTSITELNLGLDPRFDEMQQAEQSGDLRIRVNGFMAYNQASVDENGNNELLFTYWRDAPPVLDHDRFLRVLGVKVFVDGAFLPGRGCWAVSEPFTADFQQTDTFRNICLEEEYGSLYVTQQQLNDVILEVHQAGFRVAMHASGDSAIDVALNAIEHALDGDSNEAYRHQIHHSTFLRPDQIPRYQELNVPAGMRGTFSSCSDPWAFIFGQERFDFVVNRYSLPALLEHTFAEGDFGWFFLPDEVATRTPLNPLQVVWGLVTRKEVAVEDSLCAPEDWMAQGQISVEQALRMVTIEPAYAVSQDSVLGTLKAGKFADIVILDANPLVVGPDAILNISALMTMVGGRVEFCREGSEALCPETTTSVRAGETGIPVGYGLRQNYPNPFNPSTTIAFDLAGGRSQSVNLAIYNLSGEKVTNLVDARLQPGSYRILWDGRDANSQPVATGVYLYRLHTEDFSATKKLIILK